MTTVVVWPWPSATTSPAQQGVSLTLYNAQHVPLAEAWVADFTAKDNGHQRPDPLWEGSGVGAGAGQEGENSQADVFITENSRPCRSSATRACSRRSTAEALNQVPPPAVLVAARRLDRNRGPHDGLSLRHRRHPPGTCQVSLMDLADPSWSQGSNAAGADLQAVVSAVLQVEGTGGDRSVAGGPEGKRSGVQWQPRHHGRREQGRD